MVLMVACQETPSTPPAFADCPDLACRQAWVLENFEKDPVSVRMEISQVLDPIEQHALVSLVGEEWPEEIDALCSVLRPGEGLKRCEAIQ